MQIYAIDSKTQPTVRYFLNIKNNLERKNIQSDVYRITYFVEKFLLIAANQKFILRQLI